MLHVTLVLGFSSEVMHEEGGIFPVSAETDIRQLDNCHPGRRFHVSFA